MAHLQPTSREFSNYQSRSFNDADSFDTDGLSGSLPYDDDSRANSNMNINASSQQTLDYEMIRKDDKQSKKKQEASEKRMERQREKDEKKARQNEEKQRKQSQSRTRTNEEKITKSSNKKLKACVVLLDEAEEYIEFERNDTGHRLFHYVCTLLHLEEKDYFGLTYATLEQMRAWLEHDKRILSQLKGADPVFYFQVKFYPPEPALLQDDLTRYKIRLQIQNDIISGRLPCSFVTYALLGSYIAQAELKDYDEAIHGPSHHYLADIRFAPVQNEELLRSIHEQHKRHRGQPPNAADLHFLENAKKLALYGVDLHPARDSENVDISIGVSANGLLIYRERLRINRFAWPKILKISYKKKYFYVKLRPSEYDQYESTIGFKLPSYRAAKSLWKVAVEHHSFFRLRRPDEIRKIPILPKFNSNFRYTGKYTYHQVRQALHDRPNPEFERALNQRMTKSLDILNDSSAADDYSNKPTKPIILQPPPPPPPPQPQSIKPFLESQPVIIYNDEEDLDSRPTVVDDPEYAYVKKKSDREPEVKPKPKPPLLPTTYVNINVKPPTKPPPPPPPPRRDPTPTIDSDEAMLKAIHIATDLDPNKETTKVVMNDS